MQIHVYENASQVGQAAAMLIANGTWDAKRMVNVEEQDPAPFIALMNTMGLVTRIKDEHGDRVLDPVREQSIREPEKKRARA